MMLELYNNPQAPVPDYESIEHLSVHISFVVDHIEVFRARLVAAGARPLGEVSTGANGDKVANLRDPWGVPIQFVQRVEPMLGSQKPAKTSEGTVRKAGASGEAEG
jgi:glyoxylase I family protein